MFEFLILVSSADKFYQQKSSINFGISDGSDGVDGDFFIKNSNEPEKWENNSL
jgi:hypothetical protein